MAFESVKTAGATWEPKQSGSKKAGTLKEKQPTESSHIIGWYMGTKNDVGSNNSSVHTIKMKEVGNEADIVGEIIDDKVQIWGNGVLDSLLANSIQVGQFVMIKWLGKKKSKAGNDYHDWDVMVDSSVEPVTGMTPLAQELMQGAKTEPQSAQAVMEDDDSDLPF